MHFDRSRVVIAVAAAVLLLPTTVSAQAVVPTTRPTHQDLTTTRAGNKDWITHGGAMNNQRYSTLDQVNTTNVQNLKGAWLTRLGSGRGSKYRFEADPLVIDGVMYVPTGNDDVFALDAATGRKIWEYYSDIPQTNDQICCGWNNRGVAAGEGMIYQGQLDSTVVGIDQLTGQIKWKVQLEDFREGYAITGATRYYDGLVFTGISGGEYGVRGRVYALDSQTGREVWRFYTVAGPGEVGGDTWPSNDPDPVKANIYQRGGATVWQGPAVDPELGMMYFSTGNCSPWEGSLRPGDNLFCTSIVAIDYKTGQYRWHFQQIIHEIWDYDNPSPVVLFDQTYNGVPRKGLFEASKTGWLYFLDRTNGEPLIGMEYRPVPQEARQNTSPVQPYPVGDAFVNQCPEPGPHMEPFPLSGCIFTPYWDINTVFSPAAGGGSNWSPPSYHVPTGYVFVHGSESATGLAVKTDWDYEPGKRYTRVTSVAPPDMPLTNTFTAMDSRTNKIVWQKRKPGGADYGALSTAGGLAFAGQIDGNILAYDAANGTELWKFQAGWGIGAPPMTYEVNGVQYVSVAAGGNRGGHTTLDGDAVWAFSLNGTIDELAAPPPIQTKVTLAGTLTRIGDPVGRPQDPGGDRIFDGGIFVPDFDFDPRRVTVPVGTTLTWTNTGGSIHTATDIKGTWDTGDIRTGQSATITFNTAGRFQYNCSPHPWMLGEVIVT